MLKVGHARTIFTAFNPILVRILFYGKAYLAYDDFRLFLPYLKPNGDEIFAIEISERDASPPTFNPSAINYSSNKELNIKRPDIPTQ